MATSISRIAEFGVEKTQKPLLTHPYSSLFGAHKQVDSLVHILKMMPARILPSMESAIEP